MLDSGQLEQQLEEASTVQRDLEDSSKVMRSLEKQLKSVTQEKDDMHKVPIPLYFKNRHKVILLACFLHQSRVLKLVN